MAARDISVPGTLPAVISVRGARYTGVLAAADIAEFTYSTAFQIMQSLRLDRGPSGPVHP